MTAESRANPVEKRIARRQHADRTAALGHNLLHGAIERTRPGPRRALDDAARQLKMALAAEHDLRVGDQPSRHRGQPVDAVLADADDGQPAPR